MSAQEQQKFTGSPSGGGVNAVYGIGVVGAWVYFFKRAATNQERIRAFFKGFVWPAFLVYALFEFLEKE